MLQLVENQQLMDMYLVELLQGQQVITLIQFKSFHLHQMEMLLILLLILRRFQHMWMVRHQQLMDIGMVDKISQVLL